MAVTACTRELSITYNSFLVGGANSATREIHGFHRLDFGRDKAGIEFDVVIVAASEAAFATACDAIEDAFSTPYADLTVTLGSTNLIAVTQSGSTALDAVATITKPGGPPDTGRSRRYRVRIEWGQPATWAATSGLRESSVTLSYTPAQRAQVTLRGTFTAITSSDAKAVHDAAIDTWAAAQMTWLGISSYELVRESDLRVSINRKTADFERVYRELIYSEGGSSSDAAIVEQSLVVTRTRRGSEFSPVSDGGTGATSSAVTAAPLMDVSARWEAWIDKGQTQDLASKWNGVRDWVIEQIKSVAGANGFGLMSVAPAFDFTENRIIAVISGLCPDPDGGPILQNSVEIVTQTMPGWETVPVWDGNPESVLLFRGQQVHLETVTRRYRELSGGAKKAASEVGKAWAVGSAAAPAAIPAASPAAQPPVAGGGERWIPVSTTSGRRPLAVGAGSETIAYDEHWTITQRRRVTAV